MARGVRFGRGCPSPVTAPPPGVLILTPLPVKNPAEDQPQPTEGAPAQPSLPMDDGILWLVSFADDDDRELRPPDIAAALRRGEIDAETIVWREGIEDWAPLGSIPSLARLLPSSGETANAPLVISNQTSTAPAPAEIATTSASSSRALVARAKGNEPSKPSAKASPDPAAPGKPESAEKPPTAPAASAAGTEAKRDAEPPIAEAPSAEPWRGKTRLGLPKAPEIKRVPSAKANADANADADANAKKPTAGTKARTPDTPKVARTPDAPRVDRAPASAKGGTASIWDDEDDGPISVDPESLRPLSPTPTLLNATALSRGTLGGLPRKPPPHAPRPSGAKPTPPPRPPAATSISSSSSSSSASSSSGSSESSDAPRGEKRASSDLPAVDLAAFGDEPVFSAESPPLDAPEVPVVDDEPTTVPKATEVAPRPAASIGAVPAPKATPATAVSAPSARAKKRSLVPLVLGGVAVAYLLSLGLDKLGPTERPPAAPAAEQESPRAPEQQAAVEPAAARPAAPTPELVARPPAASAETAASAEAPSMAPPATGKAATTTRVVGSKAEPAAKEPKPESGKAATPSKTPESEKKAEPAATPEPEQKQVDMGGEFDKSAASAALGAAASQASGCRKGADPTGVAVVHVTFSNSGRATRATIEGPPFAGTPTGGCIAAALRGAKVPPFSGDRVTVTKRVVIQ
jgi:hypothetical protein